MTDTDESRVLFAIDGPDDRGNVWMRSWVGPGIWQHNLGPYDKVAEALSDWLAAAQSSADDQSGSK